MIEKGHSCDVTGTAADVSVYLAEPLLSPHLMNLHHAVDGWISFGILDSGGGSMKWLRDALYKWDGQSFSYAQIDEEARQVPPRGRWPPLFPVPFRGKAFWVSMGTGSIFGPSSTPSSRAFCSCGYGRSVF